LLNFIAVDLHFHKLQGIQDEASLILGHDVDSNF